MKKEPNISSNKSFGIVFCLFFLIVAFYPLLNDREYSLWAIIISLFFLILGLTNSSLLTPFNILWYKFGFFIGKIVSPIIMALVFFVIVTPTGLIMRLFNKDLLKLKKENTKSYWIERKTKSKMKNQF